LVDDYEAQLYDGLRGRNLAVVALHEITHAVHHRYELKTRDKHIRFRQAQVRGWLGIMKHDPDTWRWLTWIMSFPDQARIIAPRPIEFGSMQLARIRNGAAA
jgi:hypothetical protein